MRFSKGEQTLIGFNAVVLDVADRVSPDNLAEADEVDILHVIIQVVGTSCIDEWVNQHQTGVELSSGREDVINDGLVNAGSAIVEVGVALADSDLNVPDIVGGESPQQVEGIVEGRAQSPVGSHACETTFNVIAHREVFNSAGFELNSSELSDVLVQELSLDDGGVKISEVRIIEIEPDDSKCEHELTLGVKL